MVADPGQTTPINDQAAVIAKQLQQAAKDWEKGVTANLPAKVKGKTVDQRPIEVGYQVFPITMLPARDGEPMDGVKRSSSAPNCSYFVNWTSTKGSMVWLIDVVTSGRYQVTIDYTAPATAVGAKIALSFNDAKLTGTIEQAWDPPLNSNQDTIPRPPAESQMKPFKAWDLGVITLQKGSGALTLQATEVPNNAVMDVRRITLTLLP
jgi:hypothetical protein